MVAAVQNRMSESHCLECSGPVDRSRASYCGEKCRRKAEYRRLKPAIYAYQAKNVERISAKAKEWRAANPEKEKATRLRHRVQRLAALKAWKAKNQDRVRELRRLSAKRHLRDEYRKRWQAANIEAVRKSKSKWAKANPGIVAAKSMRRIAAKLKATPAWLTAEHLLQIRSIYESAAISTRTSGVPHDVDHFIPLQSKTVCGLHVPWNLRLLPKLMNIKKSNKYVA